MKNLILFLLLIFACACKNKLSNEALLSKYQFEFENHNWEESIKYLNQIIKRNPDNADAYYVRALANSNLKAKNNFALIVSDLNNSLRIDSTNENALFIRFQTYFVNEKYDKAVIDIDDLIVKKGERPFLLIWKGNCAFASKQFKMAEETYLKRLELGGAYEDMKNTCYYWILSKYFGGNKKDALLDATFLPNRGFQEDTLFVSQLLEDQISWEKVAVFPFPKMTIGELHEQLQKK